MHQNRTGGADVLLTTQATFYLHFHTLVWLIAHFFWAVGPCFQKGEVVPHRAFVYSRGEVVPHRALSTTYQTTRG